MAFDESVAEELAFLTRSVNRAAILETLSAEGPMSRRDLQGRFDVARTTVGRNLEGLEERGWVRAADDGTYALTDAGALLARGLGELADAVGVASRLRPFLEYFPSEAFDLDLERLADATLVVSEPSDPYAPVNRHMAAMEAAGRFRCLLPAVGLPALQVAHERVMAGQEQSLVVDPGVAATLRADPTYAEAIGEMISTGRCAMYEADSSVPIYLGVTEDVVQIGVEDDDGVPRALVESADTEVRKWAEGTIAEYEQQGRPLRVDDR